MWILPTLRQCLASWSEAHSPPSPSLQAFLNTPLTELAFTARAFTMKLSWKAAFREDTRPRK